MRVMVTENRLSPAFMLHLFFLCFSLPSSELELVVFNPNFSGSILKQFENSAFILSKYSTEEADPSCFDMHDVQ